MLEKWTDQDMIEFANGYSEYYVDGKNLEDFIKDKKQRIIKERIDKLIDEVAADEKLLDKLEKIINEK